LHVRAAAIAGTPNRAEQKEVPRGWYPNSRQRWVIWIAAILAVLGLMIGDNGLRFAFCVALLGGLLVWKLQK
jgi:hypothetical protein